ncbi:rRNA maturation RNase YbeY [Acetobacter indonesiensis]|uniref:rRNA maturation RNase YbeY n=1 Tax=Acetobacter indonesiensis TaxID=104101 RepID=UPI0020A3A2E6|nr:rRNA maturation RNase YbeY [Acetobacter indonesiensis]MCP1230670.1 rRNA maturation RNase YbeY [Acetobacter indonesiensis]
MEPPSSSSHVQEQNVAYRESSVFAESFPSSAFDEAPEVLVEDWRWRSYVTAPEKLVWRALAACTDYGRQPGSVVLSTDRVVKRLNGVHRGKHRPTNVLTFDPPPGLPGGDIILALETVVREAQKAGRPVSHHLAHLIIHGSLHLAGYDHHHAGEAREMEMLEARLLSRLGVPNPWKPRS